MVQGAIGGMRSSRLMSVSSTTRRRCTDFRGRGATQLSACPAPPAPPQRVHGRPPAPMPPTGQSHASALPGFTAGILSRAFPVSILASPGGTSTAALAARCAPGSVTGLGGSRPAAAGDNRRPRLADGRSGSELLSPERLGRLHPSILELQGDVGDHLGPPSSTAETPGGTADARPRH